MEIKCKCLKCGERLAFDVEDSGRIAVCAHCGQETMLYIPAAARAVSAPCNAAPQSQADAGDDLGGLVLAGYLTAIFLPLIGFIIGIILMAKNRPGSGIVCAVLSVVATGFWFTAFSSGMAF